MPPTTRSHPHGPTTRAQSQRNPTLRRAIAAHNLAATTTITKKCGTANRKRRTKTNNTTTAKQPALRSLLNLHALAFTHLKLLAEHGTDDAWTAVRAMVRVAADAKDFSGMWKTMGAEAQLAVEESGGEKNVGVELERGILETFGFKGSIGVGG